MSRTTRNVVPLSPSSDRLREDCSEGKQRFLEVVDWNRYQHYGDRDPIWFKVYREMFEDRTFCRLTTHRRFVLLGVMYLAARTGNRIPFDRRWIRRQLDVPRLTTDDLKALINTGMVRVIELADDCEDGSFDSLPEKLTRASDKSRGKFRPTERRLGGPKASSVASSPLAGPSTSVSEGGEESRSVGTPDQEDWEPPVTADEIPGLGGR